MNVIKVIRVALTACTLLAGAAHATVLNLPDANPLSTGNPYNAFQVYSLDLLQQCQPVDVRCQPSGPFPVASSPGQIKDQAVVLTQAGGLTNYDGPFVSTDPVDNPFNAATGSGLFTMSDGAPVGDKIVANRWDIKLSLLKSYLAGHDLVFLFDNNQQGDGTDQFVNIWAQARIVHADGSLADNSYCFQLSLGTGCDISPDPTPATNTFVEVASGFCVDKITGASYDGGGSCPINLAHTQGGYLVNNNLSTNKAEFAATNLTLNALVDSLGDPNNDLYLSINLKYIGNNAGAEQLWICSECDATGQRVNVPEPATLALFGISLLGLAFFRRRHI
jgi:hypothetical protein